VLFHGVLCLAAEDKIGKESNEKQFTIGADASLQIDGWCSKFVSILVVRFKG